MIKTAGTVRTQYGPERLPIMAIMTSSINTIAIKYNPNNSRIANFGIFPFFI